MLPRASICSGGWSADPHERVMYTEASARLAAARRDKAPAAAQSGGFVKARRTAQARRRPRCGWGGRRGTGRVLRGLPRHACVAGARSALRASERLPSQPASRAPGARQFIQVPRMRTLQWAHARARRLPCRSTSATAATASPQCVLRERLPAVRARSVCRRTGQLPPGVGGMGSASAGACAMSEALRFAPRPGTIIFEPLFPMVRHATT